MRFGIAGKGGVGKTTISAVLARSFAVGGHRVIAIDCDSDPNLAANVGLRADEVATMRPILDQSGPARSVPTDVSPTSMVQDYGRAGPDQVTLMLAARAEKAGSGCTGAAHVVVRELIERFDAEMAEAVVVADMEAGLEHLSWAGGTLRYVDMLLVVVEAQVKVLLTARRIIALARQLGIPSVALVGNRVAAGDQQRLAAFASEQGCELLAIIPDDDAMRRADRVGVCPLDSDPEAIAVKAIGDLASTLERRFMGR